MDNDTDITVENTNNNQFIVAPSVNSEEHTVSNQLWETLTNEINLVVARIDNNEELAPEDVQRVRTLKTQVEEYLTTFNVAMREAQATYKNLVAKQLSALGYTKIENYIAIQREKQTNEQNTRLSIKMNTLRDVINEVLSETKHVKMTVLAGELMSLFCSRFPKIKSAAKDKDIKNWEPYKTVIRTNLNMLDMFFSDPLFTSAITLPITSHTMQRLMTYLRSGDINDLQEMRVIFEKDKDYFAKQTLQSVITSKEIALDIIRKALDTNESVREKLANISKVVGIAMTLPD